jgi:hypothetical protein
MPFLALLDGAFRPPAATVARRPPVALRSRVRLHRLALTRRLAEGADPLGSPELALRARQLTAPREVQGAVTGLERVLHEAAAPSRALTAQAPVQRAAIVAARPFLLNLRRRLRETESPRPAGVARTVLLLADGCGPLYAPSHPGTLASRAYQAADTV